MISTRHFIVLILCLFISSSAISQQHENQEKWLEIYQLEREGLTKSALEKVNDLLSIAEKASNDSEVLKASLYQSKYWLLLEENARLKVLQSFRDRIEQSDFPYRNFYELITAQSLNNYLIRNRFRIGNRDAEKVDTTDFNFWNEAMFQEEIHGLYQRALTGFQTNDTLKFENFSTLFWKDGIEEPQTEYVSDYILEQTLEFYLNGLNLADFKNLEWLPSFEDYWDVDAFLSLSISYPDSSFSRNYGFKLLQELIAKQKALGKIKRYVNWELYRLKLLQNRDYNATTSYINALNNLANSVPDEHRITVLFAKAEILNQQGSQYSYNSNDKSNRWKKQEAYALCQEIVKLAPDSFEAKQANALSLLIEQANLTIQQERFTQPNRYSRVQVEFQNHQEIQFSIYKGSWGNIQNIVNYFIDDGPDQLASLTEVKNWKVDLPNTNDYQKHATEILIDPLPHGQYLLVAYDASQKRILARGGFQVTNHSFIELPSQRGKEYLISNRATGKAVSGAEVRLQSGQSGNSKTLDINLTSDSNGRIRYSTKTYHYNVSATVVVNRDTTYFGEFYIYKDNNNSQSKEKLTVRADVFTDRAIYRPGQKLYFKGIISKKYREKQSVFTDQRIGVKVNDSNQDEIYEKTFLTNEFGSFSDSLTIPKSILPGLFSIQIEGIDSEGKYINLARNGVIGGRESFRVENYKRPKFEVKAEPITETYVLGDSIEFIGKAVALAGNNISGASVKYIIKRTGYSLSKPDNDY